MASSNLVLRRATKDDYQGVMDIGVIYEGRDYLPAKYNKYIDSFNCWVFEIGGEIVAYAADRLVDGGQTVMTLGARSKPTHQGQGLILVIMKSILARYKDEPRVKFHTNTVNNIAMDKYGGVIRKTYTVITHRDFVEFEIDVGTFGRAGALLIKPSEKVRELREDDMRQIFKSPETCQRLFPENRIMPDRHPFRLMEENIPLLFDGRRFWGTKDSSGEYTTITITDVYHLGSRLVQKICIYGVDVDDIRHHILKHIRGLGQLVSAQSCSSIWVHIFHRCSSFDEIHTCFSRCGFHVTDYPINKTYHLESPYNPAEYYPSPEIKSKI